MVAKVCLLTPKTKAMISKWLFDRVMSLVGLIVISPVLLIVALLIRQKMPGGPVLFRQKRVGKDGKLLISQQIESCQSGLKSIP